jgi:hypothetical protein
MRTDTHTRTQTARSAHADAVIANADDDVGGTDNDDEARAYEPRMLPVFLIGRVVAPESDTILQVRVGLMCARA